MLVREEATHSIEKLAAEAKAERGITSSLTHDDILAVFDTARDAYKKHSTISFDEEHEIIPVKVPVMDVTSLTKLSSQKLDEASTEVTEYKSYIAGIGIAMLREIVDSPAILDFDEIIPDTVNTPFPSLMICTDLEACGADHVGDVINKIRDGETHLEQYLITILADGSVHAVSVSEDKILYPNETERAYSSALSNALYQ